MSFGSAMRFEVKDGGKGGIFWQKEKPKQNQRKFGYKSKQLRHAIRKPHVEYIEEPVKKPDPSKDFIRKNRNQYRKPAREEDKENQSRNSTRSGYPSSEIKPGTVTLTQDQLNALLATVGKMNPSEASNLRISIDAEGNRLQVETPRDHQDSAPNSSRSGQGSVQGETSIFDLAKKDNSSEPSDNNRDSSGYHSEERSGGKKGVQFDTARNEERAKTPEASPAPPPLVPWKHMTVGERKRLQWARERAAEEEAQRKTKSYQEREVKRQEPQQEYNPWGRPGGGAPSQKPELEKETKRQEPQQEYSPWGRPGAGAPLKKPEPEKESGFRTKEEEELRKAIDEIEAKYGSLLNPADKERENSRSLAGQGDSRGDKDKHSKKSESSGIPGLDESYAMNLEPAEKKKSSKSSKKHLEDRGNARPSRKQERREDDREREKGRDGQKRGDRQKREEDEEERRRLRRREEEKEESRKRERQRREEEIDQAEANIREQAEQRAAAAASAAPSAMQTSLFIGQAEPDNSRFLSKKEEEKKRWLEELDRQREEKRLEKQREKDRQREGVDDRWADRFVSDAARRPAQPQEPPPSQQLPAAPFASGGPYDSRPGRQSKMSEESYSALPPAAMRSAIAIGDAAPNLDRIEQKKVEERRLWLEELNKQREEQREARMRLKDKQTAGQDTWADRFTDHPRTAAAAPASHNAPAAYDAAASSHRDNSDARTNSAPQPVVTDSLDEQNRTYLRGQNVHVDPVTKREMEEKRRKHLEYQAAIKAQIEEKEKQKRLERERKWKEEIEEERKLKAERDHQKNQLEAEDMKHRQREEARQRQVDHLKSLMDAEQDRAQEERMMKRLTALQQAGHDVSGLKAHYEAITPRINQTNVNAGSVPGLQPSPRDLHGSDHSPRGLASTYRAGDGPLAGGALPKENGTTQYDHYMENRILTPSRFRTSHNQLDFATQTDDELERLTRLQKELSEVEIEYRERHNNTNNKAGGTTVKNGRTRSADRKNPAENPRGKPPVSKSGLKKPAPQHPLKGKPTQWNYQNPKKKAPVKQSEKDPFYETKRQESEERRAKRERQLNYLVELNKQVIPTERHNVRSNQELSPRQPASDFAADSRMMGDKYENFNVGDLSHRSLSPPVNRTGGRYRPADRNHTPPQSLARQNRGDGRDFETGYNSQAQHSHRHPDPHRLSPTMDERGNIKVPVKDTDFIPIMRTTDILDPSRADDPLKLSRENTRIKQARKHYHENLHPADYGNQLDMYEDRQRVAHPGSKDPILNPGLVKDFPTARQDQILQQLSTLKQSLIQRQREIETCMSPSDLAIEKQV